MDADPDSYREYGSSFGTTAEEEGLNKMNNYPSQMTTAEIQMNGDLR